jgi:membrane-bound lytic murein transglycosylase MltF
MCISFRAATLGFAAVGLLLWSCARETAPEPVKAEQKGAEAQPESKSAPVPMDEAIPPLLRTPWKGDLDEIVKRRVVRVLIPFRRPEFFYMEARPVGILQEAFQELERVLNAKYKTTAANRIIVGLLPTPIDKLRDRMVNGYGDIAAYSLSITEQSKALVDFTAPTMTGLKIVAVTGPGAPELQTVNDLSGKEIWISPQTRMKKDLEDLNARFKSQGKAPAVMREIDALMEPGDIPRWGAPRIHGESI